MDIVIIVLNYTLFLPLAAGDLVTETTTKKLVKDNEDVAASATGEVRKLHIQRRLYTTINNNGGESSCRDSEIINYSYHLC